MKRVVRVAAVVLLAALGCREQSDAAGGAGTSTAVKAGSDPAIEECNAFCERRSECIAEMAGSGNVDESVPTREFRRACREDCQAHGGLVTKEQARFRGCKEQSSCEAFSKCYHDGGKGAPAPAESIR